MCIHNPAGCFGLGFLWNVIPRVCGRGLVIWCGKRARGADGFEFRSRDKDNPRVSKCQIISTRTLSRLALTSISGEVAIASIARENAGNFVSRMVPNGRSSFVARLSFWVMQPANYYHTGESCEEIHIAGLYDLAQQARNYLMSSERWIQRPKRRTWDLMHSDFLYFSLLIW